MYEFPAFLMPEALPPGVLAEAAERKPRLESDLETARRQVRPPWVAETEMPPIEITDERLPMRREVDSRFQRNEHREAVRVLYELIDRSSGEAQRFAKHYIKEGLMWAGEIPFSMLAYEHALPDPMSHLQLGMCYLHYRQYESALEQFRTAIELAPNSDSPTEMLRGRVFWSAAQLYQYADDLDTAAQAYTQAERCYRLQSEQPDIRDSFKNDLISRAEQMAEMVEFCNYVAGSGIGAIRHEAESEGGSSEVFSGSSQGYSGRVDVEVTVNAGRIERVEVSRHKESNPLTAIEVVPRRIVEHQTLNVEWVPGAKFTSRAIVAAAFRALAKR